MTKTGVWFHRIIRAFRSLVRAFRTSGPGHRTADRALTPNGRTAWHRPNPWPRCVACHRHVVALCPESCGVCPSCCSGEH
jgi:hypothetical protein